MFKKILIANRGEIALRVICACRELGIKTVAVYSEADENSLHVRFADEDVCIGPARSADSYLSVPAVISAAEITGADAIHPGYGFLSESAYLAEVCEACHIKFIGPAPNVIRLLGDKARARRAMKKAGVPMLPGSDGPVDSEEKALKVAKDLGYPGDHQGGRRRRRPRHARHPGAGRAAQGAQDRAARSRGGVRRRRRLHREVRREARATSSSRCSAITTARSCTSASASARSSAVIRSCSKKAPSVAVTEKMRRKLGGTVVDAARAVQYTNAGTFEFLLDDKGNFFFLEVNTRVQVEHPVTEFITGVDIVKEQIRIAAGERLSFKQGDVTFNGHAIECRINAEDPETFAPSPGVIHAFSVPGGPGVRVDTFAAFGVHDLAVLRFDDRQDHRPRPRSPGSDRAHAPHARDDRHRGHQDIHSAAPEDPGGAGFRRRQARHGVHGALPRREEDATAAGSPKPSRRLVESSRSATFGIPFASPLPSISIRSSTRLCAAAGHRSAGDVATRMPGGRCALLQLREKDRRERRGFSASPMRSSTGRSRPGRMRHRQRSGRHRAD